MFWGGLGCFHGPQNYSNSLWLPVAKSIGSLKRLEYPKPPIPFLMNILAALNTFTAADDCSRFYRSLPPTTVVVLQIYRYVPGYR